MTRALLSLTIATIAFTTACGGGGAEKETPATTPSAATPAAAPGSPITPREGGKVITIEMTTDDKGNNKFTPSDFEAHQGDVMRFTLATGVHNVHFLADSNRTLTNPPVASPLLQLPGQTYDIAVDFPEGRYYFQCDPHALLGMIGHVKVEKRD
jgi:plastocyanin